MVKRGRSKVTADYTLADSYKAYIDNLADKRSKYNVSRTVYTAICKEMNEAIFKLMVDDNFEFRLPSRMGIQRVKKWKPVPKFDEKGELITTNLPVDWKATMQLWKEDKECKEAKQLVFHTNTHTNGYKCKWYWSKKICNVANKTVYQFIPSRDMKRYLAKRVKEDKSLNFYE